MNSNPFDPVIADPATDPPQTDDAADDFTADDDKEGGPDETTKAPLSIDGISPQQSTDAAEDNVFTSNSPIDDSIMPVKAASAAAASDALTGNGPGDFLSSMTTENPAEPIASDPPTPPILAPVESAPPVKHVTISLLTIIFFILALVGAVGTIYFYLQNNKNADALADANAKIQQLEDELSTNATAENTTAGQYNGLNNKIENLSGQNEENLKTIDEYKKKVEDQAKQITDLTAKNTELNKKVTEINELMTKIDQMLNRLDDIFTTP
ncbi:hypothetical protein FWH58_01805 [Candidatus Saccharibacteria bacterium]|nr:hypothetical protein [Candidatus Saccharibacteria bacterium]